MTMGNSRPVRASHRLGAGVLAAVSVVLAGIAMPAAGAASGGPLQARRGECGREERRRAGSGVVPALALVHGGGHQREQQVRGTGVAARCLASAERSPR